MAMLWSAYHCVHGTSYLCTLLASAFIKPSLHQLDFLQKFFFTEIFSSAVIVPLWVKLKDTNTDLRHKYNANLLYAWTMCSSDDSVCDLVTIQGGRTPLDLARMNCCRAVVDVIGTYGELQIFCTVVNSLSFTHRYRNTLNKMLHIHIYMCVCMYTVMFSLSVPMK